MHEREFQEFLDATGEFPPQRISDQILSEVHRDLNPGGASVFLKLVFVHTITALFTLSICPQLGFKIGGEGLGLMQYFMSFGPYGCMAACGFFFLGMSLLIASLVLRPEELRVLRKRRGLEIGSLVVLSLGFFMALNPQTLFVIAMVWAIGSFAGGTLILEVGWWIRSGRFAHA